MTELLRRAITEIESMPEDTQDAIAARLLAEIEDEQLWARKFAATTDAQWDAMARMVEEEIASKGTSPLDEAIRLDEDA